MGSFDQLQARHIAALSPAAKNRGWPSGQPNIEA